MKRNFSRVVNFRSLIALGLFVVALINGQACSQGFRSLQVQDQYSINANTPDFQNGSGSPTLPIVVPTPVAVNCQDPGMRGASKSGLRRLNRIELTNTIQRLFPGYLPELINGLAAYPDIVEMTDVDEYSQLYSVEQMQQWALITDYLANLVAVGGNEARGLRYGMAGDCFNSNPITEPCWSKFYNEFGKRVYRRPLTTNDTAFLKKQIEGLSDHDAVYRTLTILLRSPDFLFHLESGQSEEASRVRLTDYEVANRVAYALTASPPDAELTKAADEGRVRTVAQVEQQAKRLIATAAAQSKLKTFFAEWLQFDHFAGADYLLTDFGARMRFEQNDMRTDVEDYLKEVVWTRAGSFKELMTSSTVFARNTSYRNAYAVNGFDGSGATSYQSPDHPGLLTRVGFLSNQGTAASPIRRGVFVQRRILCESMPTPDFSVVAIRLDEIGKLSGMDHSNSELTTLRTNDKACIGCHARINPLGFSFEAYDALGKSHRQETFIDWSAPYSTPLVPYYADVPDYKDGKYRGKIHPLPYPVSNVSVDTGKKITVNSPLDLAKGIGESGQAMACMTKFIIRHYERRKEVTGDACLVNEVTEALKSGAPVSDAFVKVLANEEIFWRAK